MCVGPANYACTSLLYWGKSTKWCKKRVVIFQPGGVTVHVHLKRVCG